MNVDNMDIGNEEFIPRLCLFAQVCIPSWENGDGSGVHNILGTLSHFAEQSRL